MDWHHYVKKYVWDTNKTPYFVPVPRLTRIQAHNEIFIYALFVGVPAMLVTVATTTSVLDSGSSTAAMFAIYALTLGIAAGLLHVRKHTLAAYYTMSLPLALLAYLYLRQQHTDVALFDTLVLVAVMLGWLRYLYRVTKICEAYGDMPEAWPEEPGPEEDAGGA